MRGAPCRPTIALGTDARLARTSCQRNRILGTAPHEINGARGRLAPLSPRLVHFHLRLPGSVRPSRSAPLLGEIAEALQVPAVRLAPDPETGEPVLEVPRPDLVPVRLLPLAKKSLRSCRAARPLWASTPPARPSCCALTRRKVFPTLVRGRRPPVNRAVADHSGLACPP